MGKPFDMAPADYNALEATREGLARKAIDASAKAFEAHKETGAENGVAAEAFSRLSTPAVEDALNHTESIMLPLTLTWKFGVDATENTYPGDHTADTTVFTDRSAYHAALAKQCEVAQGDSRIHRVFAGAMLPKDKRYRLWEIGYPKKPYSYQTFKPLSLLSACTTCGGTGERPCGGCNGSGTSVCSTCKGSGKSTCDTCEGTTRLTQVSLVSAIATPELAINSNVLATSSYGALFTEWLKGASLTARNFWVKLSVRPSVEPPKVTAGSFSVKYYALPTFTRLRFTLTTVSGEPVEYSDYLLASGDSLKSPTYLEQILPEIAQSLEAGTKGLFLSWRKTLKLYRQMCNFKVLSDLMSSMAASPTVSYRVHANHTFGADKRRTISDQQAMQIGKSVEKVMSAVSRRTNPFVWVVVTLLFGGYGLLLQSSSVYHERFALTDMQIIPLLAVLTIPVFALGYVASRLLVWRRHRHLRREHRKKGKEWVAALLSMVACMSITFGGNAVASNTQYKFVPPPRLIQAQELASLYTREAYTTVSLWILTEVKHSGRH